MFLKALTIQTITHPVILKSFSGSPSFIQSTEASGPVRQYREVLKIVPIEMFQKNGGGGGGGGLRGVLHSQK